MQVEQNKDVEEEEENVKDHEGERFVPRHIIVGSPS